MPLAIDPRLNRPQKAIGEDDYTLQLRVLAEFRDMPGLRLTLPQAARLFDIEPARCGRMLAALVDSGCLAIDGSVFLSGRRWP